MSDKKLNFTEVLSNIQTELKAPKNQTNKFGKYKYRSCEDILEGVKPLLLKYKAVINLSDELVLIGDRYYIKAIATLQIDENLKSATGYARESLTKKGMDESQITGTASSYARKYALNGLLAIDDNKDDDKINDKTPAEKYQEKNNKTENKPNKNGQKNTEYKNNLTFEQLYQVVPDRKLMKSKFAKKGRSSEEARKICMDFYKSIGNNTEKFIKLLTNFEYVED